MSRLTPFALLTAAAAVCYSCTFAADVTTDPHGRIVDVTLVKLESSIQGVALGMLISGRELALQFAWTAVEAGGRDRKRTQGSPSF